MTSCVKLPYRQKGFSGMGFIGVIVLVLAGVMLWSQFQLAQVDKALQSPTAESPAQTKAVTEAAKQPFPGELEPGEYEAKVRVGAADQDGVLTFHLSVRKSGRNEMTVTLDKTSVFPSIHRSYTGGGTISYEGASLTLKPTGANPGVFSGRYPYEKNADGFTLKTPERALEYVRLSSSS